MGCLRALVVASVLVLVSVGLPGEAAAQTPLQQLEQLSDQARAADEAHANAAKVCDRETMRAQLEALNRLAREARQIANAARAAGEFATINPENAARLAAIIATRARVAASRKPENCDERDASRKEYFDKVQAALAAMEAARLRGDCETFRNLADQAEHDISLERPVGYVDGEEAEAQRQRLRELEGRPCPPQQDGRGDQAPPAQDPRGGTVQQPPPAGTQGQAQPEPPPSLRDQALTANLEHARAADRCDAAEMERLLQEIERLAREADRLSRQWDLYSQNYLQYQDILKILEAARTRQRAPCPKHRRPRLQQQQQQQPRQGALRLDRTSEQLLALHNQVRTQAGSPPLQWDSELAAQAASYGPQLAQHGRPVHAPRAGREKSRENLLQALPGTPVDRMVGVWIAERRNFTPGIFPNVSRTGNWADVGHYTQMIWRTTTHVGCAVHRGGRFDWLICRYWPPGNQDGKPVL